MQVKNIIFDLGGVLIDWNPEYLYKKIIPDENQRKWFLENICTFEWNEEQDGGRTIQEANKILIEKYPDFKEWIESYYARWEEMLSGPLQETVELFKELKKKNTYSFYALTNWSAETFPRALEIFDFLHWFDGRLVSGEVNLKKPQQEIYELIISKYNLIPEQTLFIDDNVRNINAAKETGLICLHFQSSSQVKNYLLENNLLPSS